MASTKSFKDYVIEQLRLLDDITCRPMMGEYILYKDGIIFGGIYDDRFLVKIVDSNKKYKMEEAIPYPKGKPMFLVEDIDDIDMVRDIVLDTCEGLSDKNE